MTLYKRLHGRLYTLEARTLVGIYIVPYCWAVGVLTCSAFPAARLLVAACMHTLLQTSLIRRVAAPGTPTRQRKWLI